jgi:hypothetical protein
MAFGVRTAYHTTDIGAIAAELGHPDWLNEKMAADAARRRYYRTTGEHHSGHHA